MTALFLRPIYKVLRETGSAGSHSAGYRNMLKTKWMTLIGSTFAVMSSTVLYVNVILWVLSEGGDPFWTNPLLNPFVTGINADSIANNLSMILVCGVIKTLSGEALYRRISTAVSPGQRQTAVVQPPPVFEFINSQAYNE